MSILLLFVGACNSKSNKLTITNNSPLNVASISVEVCQKKYDFFDIESGGSSVAIFEISGDSGFVFYTKLADGTTIVGNFGYVTKSYSSQGVDIIINKNYTINAFQNGVKMKVKLGT